MITEKMIISWHKALYDYAQKIGYGECESPMPEEIHAAFECYYRDRLLMEECVKKAETATEISHWMSAIGSLNKDFANYLYSFLKNFYKQSQSGKKGIIKASTDGTHD